MHKITHIIFNLKNGGAEKLLIEMVKNDNNRINHQILVIGKEKKNNFGIYNKITYLNYNIFRYLNYIIKNRKKNYILKYWLHNVFILSIFPLIIGKYKIILSIHNELITPKYLGYKNFIFCFLNKIISNYFQINIIYCSQSSKNHHLNFGFKANNVVVHNFINCDKYNFFPKKSLNKKSKLKFVMVANNTLAKNHQLLIRILHKLSFNNYSCDLYGYGLHYDSKLKKLISKLNMEKKINLKKFKHSKNLFLNYDFSFLISDTESFPMVILESICQGTLCISSNVGDISKIITNNNFLLNNSQTIDHLAEKVDNTLKLRYKSDDYNEILNDTLLNIKEKFDAKIIFPKYHKFWSKLKS